MESQETYRQRLGQVMDSYCQKKEAERETLRKQQLANNTVTFIAILLLLFCLGSIESIVDLVLSIL